MDISMIGIALFNFLMQRAFQTNDIQIFSFSICNIEKTLASRPTTNPTKKLPTKYHKFFNVFSQANSDILLPHHFYNHKIPLIEGKTLFWRLLYSMFEDRLKCLKKYLEKHLDKSFIRASSSSAVSPILFACKPGGALQFCIDY